jgi:hypothetical protein
MWLSPSRSSPTFPGLATFDRHFNVDGEHLRFFSDQALQRLLPDSGFTVERVIHLGRRWPVWADSFVWARRR